MLAIQNERVWGPWDFILLGLDRALHLVDSTRCGGWGRITLRYDWQASCNGMRWMSLKAWSWTSDTDRIELLVKVYHGRGLDERAGANI